MPIGTATSKPDSQAAREWSPVLRPSRRSRQSRMSTIPATSSEPIQAAAVGLSTAPFGASVRPSNQTRVISTSLASSTSKTSRGRRSILADSLAPRASVLARPARAVLTSIAVKGPLAEPPTRPPSNRADDLGLKPKLDQGRAVSADSVIHLRRWHLQCIRDALAAVDQGEVAEPRA
jgi:hypothetical protein